MILVIGIGNAWRRDDGAGPAVAERLADHGGLRTLVLPGEGSELIEAWRGQAHVIVVDAMRSGATVGTIRAFDAVSVPLPAGKFPSLSHRFGLAEAVEMARILDRLPARLDIWGIEAGDVGQGPGLSLEVETAVAEVVARLTPSPQPDPV
jgi:hydrogenase maturation protease